jgi:hypothetical protein
MYRFVKGTDEDRTGLFKMIVRLGGRQGGRERPHFKRGGGKGSRR